MQGEILTLKRKLEFPTTANSASKETLENRYAAYDHNEPRKNLTIETNKSEPEQRVNTVSSSSGFTAYAKREEDRQKREEPHQDRSTFSRDVVRHNYNNHENEHVRPREQREPRDQQYRLNSEENSTAKFDITTSEYRNNRQNSREGGRGYPASEGKPRGPETLNSNDRAQDSSPVRPAQNLDSIPRTQSALYRGSPFQQREIESQQIPLQERKERVKEDIEK